MREAAGSIWNGDLAIAYDEVKKVEYKAAEVMVRLE